MTFKQAIEKAENAGLEMPKHNYCAEWMLLQSSFWQCLGKSLGWGEKIYKTETGEEWGTRICIHCETDCAYQPSREVREKTGCEHAHYPEACGVCSEKSITWKERWHRFIDHRIKDKSIESYFESL